MSRVVVPILCVLLQLVSFGVGAVPEPTRWAAALAGASGLLAGLTLVVRNRVPGTAVAITSATYVLQVLTGGPVLPAAVAVATETLARRSAPDGRPQIRASVLVILALVGVDAAVVIVGSSFLAAPFGILLLGAALLGSQLAARAARDQHARRELVVAERLRIARDLHDVVGHGVGAITVQAGAARLAVAAGEPAEATRALLIIESAGRSVLREVRWLVGLLREDASRPVLAAIPDLVGNARRSGLDVELTVAGELGDAPADTGEAAYRIVQEALTNILRHSGTRTATVAIRVADVLQLAVADPGIKADNVPQLPEGNGLQGIRERVAAVSGTVSIGPQPGGGWSVQATLPLGGRR